MYDILKTQVNAGQFLSQTDTTAASPDPGPNNPWLFTDPVAQAIYARRGQRDQLREDIRTHVMYAGYWSQEELEFKYELRRLLGKGLLVPKGTFCYLSPHPSVYRGVQAGVLKIAGQNRRFDSGDDVVFNPWLARVASPRQLGPAHIGRLLSTTRLCLCREAFAKTSSLCERALAVLHQTLRYSSASST